MADRKAGCGTWHKASPETSTAAAYLECQQIETKACGQAYGTALACVVPHITRKEASIPVVDLLDNAATRALTKSEGEPHKQHPEVLHLLPQLPVLSRLFLSWWGSWWSWLTITSRLPGRPSRDYCLLPWWNGWVCIAGRPRGYGRVGASGWPWGYGGVGIASGSWGYGGGGISPRLSGRVRAVVGGGTSSIAAAGGLTDSCGTGGGVLAISICSCFSVMTVPIVAHRSWSSWRGGGGGRLAGGDRAIVGNLHSSFLLTADSGS